MNYKSCPHCGCTDFCVEWRKDKGDEYDAVECNNCHATAPAEWWNVRWEEFADAKAARD